MRVNGLDSCKLRRLLNLPEPPFPLCRKCPCHIRVSGACNRHPNSSGLKCNKSLFLIPSQSGGCAEGAGGAGGSALRGHSGLLPPTALLAPGTLPWTPHRPAEPEGRGRGRLGCFGRWLVRQSCPAHVLSLRLCLSMCSEEKGGLVDAGLDLTPWMGSELPPKRAPRLPAGSVVLWRPGAVLVSPGASAFPSSAVCSDTYIHCCFCFLSSF